MSIHIRFNPKSGWVGSAKSSPITYRELEVLVLLTDGHSNKEIAETLGINYQTVKNRIYQLNKKMGARNSTQALVMALQAGMMVIEVKPDDWPFDDDLKRIAPDPDWVKDLSPPEE